MTKQGFLVLQTNKIYPGTWRGGAERAGEVVFNTAHFGYDEMASDPSYFSQILVTTAPMQGNYGADHRRRESRQLWIQGFVCLEMQSSRRDGSWLSDLTTAGVPVLTGVDTRALTLHLRDFGVQWGAMVEAADEQEARAKAERHIAKQKQLDKDWAHLTSRKSFERRPGQRAEGPRLAVLDYGCKESILRFAAERSSELGIFPSRASAAEILAYMPDGILLSNGPGDPADVLVAAATVKELLGKKFICGICMGHQILALALGAKTFKLKFGHRGANHPVRDDLLGRIYVTSQNHGYAVDPQTLPSGVIVSHTNLNDHTVQGIFSEERRCLGVQFHPECHPGPNDATSLFDWFVSKLK